MKMPSLAFRNQAGTSRESSRQGAVGSEVIIRVLSVHSARRSGAWVVVAVQPAHGEAALEDRLRATHTTGMIDKACIRAYWLVEARPAGIEPETIGSEG